LRANEEHAAKGAYLFAISLRSKPCSDGTRKMQQLKLTN